MAKPLCADGYSCLRLADSEHCNRFGHAQSLNPSLHPAPPPYSHHTQLYSQEMVLASPKYSQPPQTKSDQLYSARSTYNNGQKHVDNYGIEKYGSTNKAYKEVTVHDKPFCSTPDECELARFDATHKDQFLHNCRYGKACRHIDDPIHMARFVHTAGSKKRTCRFIEHCLILSWPQFLFFLVLKKRIRLLSIQLLFCIAMATTLTELWRNDPQQFLDWICKIRVDCFYEVNKICDWLRRENNIAEPTEHELQSIGLLLAADSLADLHGLILFEEEGTTSSFAPLPSAPLSSLDTAMSDVDEVRTNHHQQRVQTPSTTASTTSAVTASNTRSSAVPPRSSTKPHTATVTLDHLVIELAVLHEAVLPFAEGELRQMIGEFVLRHTRKRIDMLNARQCAYQLIEPININDEFGGWTFDVLFGMLQVTLKLENDAPFPLCWSTQRDRTALRVVVTRGEAKLEQEVSLNHPSLEEWLQQLCDKTKMAHHYEEWLKSLREAHVDRLQHLLDWTSERWKALKMATNGLEIVQRAVAEFRYQDTTKASLNNVSGAELIANVHRIKLYFYYHLGRAGELGYLHADAVSLAFEEVAKAGYEAADLSERIKALLYSETMPAKEPKKEDKRDAKRIKQLVQIDISSVEEKIDRLQKKEAEYEAARKTEIERQLQSDEKLTAIAKELNFLKSELQEHLLQGSTAKLALHRQDRLERQINEAKRELELYKKAAVIRILRSQTCKQYRQQRRDIKANVAKLTSYLASLRSLLTSEPKSRSEILKHYRGIIFYGPPGTGKTRMMNELQKRVGFTSVVLPLAAAEVNRSLVGQTEKLILDICNRARLLPHLLCVVSIDEIDALAPKRDEKVSQHKLDSLSVLLSVIEGIKDVPNLIMLAATNRIKMMDEAFLRRMSGQFFVGRPSAQVRRRLLGALNQLGVRLLDDDVMDFALLLTTNFTGAAIMQLRSNLLVYSYMHGLDKLSIEHVVDQCRVAAKQFSISVGGYTLPDLLVNWQPETQLSLTEGDFTGRVHVDLQQKAFQIEIKDADYSTVVPLSSSNKKIFLNSILPYLVQFALDRKIDFVQVFDSSWIVSNAAYDDHKIMEVLSERINECREYKRAMMIFDLDSLVGVNDNQSTSSMGLSTSNSVSNQRLFSYLVDIAKEAKVRGDEEQWVVTTALHPYLSKTFKAAVLFSPTDDETTKERQEYERTNLHLNCQNCNLTYVEAENKLNCCSYHDGFLLDMALDARDLSPLSEDNVLPSTDSSKVLWVCCYRNIRDGGCKNSKHQPSATGQQDKISKHARALHLYRDKFEKLQTVLIEKQDRAKPRK